MNWDYQVFEWINQTATHPFLDKVLPFMRNADNWIPLYILFILLSILKYKWKSWIFILLVFAAVGSSDAIGNYGFKKNFERARPCHDSAPIEARLLVKCGSGYSFTSNHAANHMCLAIFLSGSLFLGRLGVKLALVSWALIIGYAQIYVGVHYPFDVLGGWTLGLILGSAAIFIYRKVDERIGFSIRSTPPKT